MHTGLFRFVCHYVPSLFGYRGHDYNDSFSVGQAFQMSRNGSVNRYLSNSQFYIEVVIVIGT